MVDRRRLLSEWCKPTRVQIPPSSLYKGSRKELQDRKYAAKLSFERENNIGTERFIWNDSRRSDKKFGRANDLTHEFIAAQIALGCQYCGETQLKMTLDRIDNSVGHVMTNVVPACVRCNYTRGNMPYAAWLRVAPAMRAAREAGDFGKWCGPRTGAKKLLN